MSRIFLLSTNVTVDPYPVYPLGMAVLAGALTAKGHQVFQYDFLAGGCDEALLRRAIEEFHPDLVGLSLRNIDNVDSFSGGNGWYLAQARDQVKLVRKATGAPLVVGGPAFSIMPEAILDYLGADYGIVGEGERALCALIDRLMSGETIPPLFVDSGPALKREEMAAPLYRQDLVEFYVGRSGMINLQTKRGCPFVCAYCTYPFLEGNRFRPRDPAAVVEDLRGIRRDHGNPTVFFTDSIFNDSEGHYLVLAEEIIRSQINVRWCAFFRPAGMGRPELALLKRSGLYALELGTDAASDATLSELGKGFAFSEVLRFNEDCLAERLPCAHFIIFGGPGETAATLAVGLKNIAALGPSVVFAFSGIRILPGSPLCERARREGVITAGQSLLEPFYYHSPSIDIDSMNELIRHSFQGFRQRIFPPSDGQVRMEVMRRFGFSGILWDRLVSFAGKGGRGREQCAVIP
ncbi:MAG: lipid biosynthesis B12-binding/radical SAM protein [Desulfuromonadaceae bacterium]|nr:lipid biosynthesis B12-binding/radical SAM protein [Desulfuromonadaceae bacterium]